MEPNIRHELNLLFAMKSYTKREIYKIRYKQTNNFCSRDILHLIDAAIIEASMATSIEGKNVALILEWIKLESMSLAPLTVYIALDAICLLSDRLINEPIETILADNPLQEYMAIKSEATCRQRYSKLKSLVKFLTETYNFQIKFQQRKSKRIEHSPIQLLPNKIDLRILDKKTKTTLLLGTLTGVRIFENINHNPSQVHFSERIEIDVEGGKGYKNRKSRSPKLDADTITEIYTIFTSEDSPRKKLSVDPRAIYARTIYRFKKVGLWKNSHSMRRFFINYNRMKGEKILYVTNDSGHSSIKTPMENYILIYPALQRIQFIQWISEFRVLSFPEKITLKTILEFNEMSRTGWKKWMFNNKEEASEEISVDDCIRLMLMRIRQQVLC